MYSRLPLKRHDDIVHDIDEVWRSLRRTMLLLHSADREQAAAALRFTVGIFNFVDESDAVTAAHLWTTFAELFLILEDFAEADRMYNEAYNSIVKKYGAGHLAVGDYFVMMAAVRAKQGKVNDAINCSGRALVIRMAALGLIHDRVADSHFNLGLLYRLSGDMHSSLKHLKICRGIKRTLYLERSKEVALVDVSIGQTEQWMVMYDKAYYSFYNSYRTYCILCGVCSDEARTVAAYLRQLRFSFGARFTSLVELRDIVAAADYNAGTAGLLASDVFVQHLLMTLDRSSKLVINALELKFIIYNILTSEAFDPADSRLIESVRKSGCSDQELADLLYAELIYPISDKVWSILFEKEWMQVEKERARLGDHIAEVQATHARKTADAVTRKQLASAAQPVNIERPHGSVTMKPATASKRTRSVHFSTESNEMHLLPALEIDLGAAVVAQLSAQAPTLKLGVESHGDRDKVKEDIETLDSDIRSMPPEFDYDDLTESVDENEDTLGNMENPMRRLSVGDGSSALVKSPHVAQSTIKKSFFSRAARPQKIKDFSEAEGSPPPSPEPDSDEPDGGPPSPTPFISPSTSPTSSMGPTMPPTLECNFRLGSRSLLILHDGDGKGVAIRPVTEADVISALKPKLFAFGAFMYLLKQSGKEAAVVAASVEVDAAGPVPARDSSKPLDPIPLPPSLPVGWPPHAPDEETASPARTQMSLASLFKGAGPMDSIGRKRTSVTPILKLKQVHWDMVMVPTTEGTIWYTGPADRPDGLSVVDHTAMFPDLIADFEIAKSGALSKTNAPPTPIASRKVTKSLLDPKRSQNITIMLSKFRKIPPKAIAQAILELDTCAIEQSVVQAMIEQVPTIEEQRAVKKYYEENGEDSSKLDKTENYVLETMKVPMMHARLSLMLILLSLEDVTRIVENSTNIIFTATSQLMGSARYRRLMHVILTVGNLLNKGSKKSSAVGFRLSSLPKLMQTKSNAGVSLIDYVVGHLLKQEPDVLNIATEFTNLQEVKQASFVSLNAEVAKLSVGISLGSRILEGTNSEGEASEVCMKIRKGVDNINATVKRLESLCEEAVQRFNATCIYLGEQVTDPGTLFGQLMALLDCVTVSSKEVQAKLKKAAAATTAGTSLRSVFGSATSGVSEIQT